MTGCRTTLCGRVAYLEHRARVQLVELQLGRLPGSVKCTITPGTSKSLLPPPPPPQKYERPDSAPQ